MGLAFWFLVVLLVAAVFVWIATVAMATPTVSYRLDGRFDVRSTEFLHALSAVLPATVSRGNTIHRLDDGQRFYPEMLAAIGQARRSVTLECYIFHPGRIGETFITALGERARAGVSVRIILDRFRESPIP